MEKGRRISLFLLFLGTLMTLSFSQLHAAAFNGCPDFMDLDASYVELYTGHEDHPFDSLGRVEERHRLYETQGSDPNTGGKLKFLPEGASQSVRLGNDSIGAESEAIVYHYIVDADNSLLFVNFAVVLEDPGHEMIFQPRFVIRITDKEGKLVNDCSEYDVSAAAGLAGFQDYQSYRGTVRWRDWSRIGLDLSPFVGQEVQVQFITYDCFLTAHFGYAYFTASCAPNKLSLEECSGSSFTVEAPAGFSAYRWDNGDTTRISTRTKASEDMNVYCEITSATGCTFTQSAYISDKHITVEGDITDTICQGDSYVKNNFNLPAQMNVGTFGYTNLFINPTTCTTSQEVNLQLTVLQTYYPIVAAICEGEDYEENGFHIAHPPVGVLLDTLRFSHSDGRCDSVVCLRLEVSETNDLSNEIKGEFSPCVNTTTTYFVETDDYLAKYSWTLPENVKVVSGAQSARIVLYFTDDTPATLTLVGENGCGTSAVPVTVYPKPSYRQMVADTVCQGETYALGEIQLGKQEKVGNFNYAFSFQTAAGCDSSVILSLTVLSLPQITLSVQPDQSIFCDSAEVKLSVKTEGSQTILHECEPLAVAVGDIYCSDGSFVKLDSLAKSGKMAEGVVYFVDDTAGVAYVVSKQESAMMRWSTEAVDIPGIENQMYLRNLLTDMDGYSHTANMRNQGDATLYPIAWQVDLDNGWYLPSIGELRKLFGDITVVNQSLAQVGDEIFLDNYGMNSNFDVNYVSSTEYNGSMVCCFTSGFRLYALNKAARYRYRATRAVKLSNWVVPKYKLGDVIVNSDGSQGVVCYINPDGRSGSMIALNDIEEVAMATTQADGMDLTKEFPQRLSVKQSLNEWSGYANTKKYRELGDATLFPAAWAVDFEHGWYIPTVAQMNHLYVNSICLDSALVRNGGDILSYEGCWTADFYGTENRTVKNWYVGMGQGDMDISDHTQLGAVRPMRDFTYCEDYEEFIDSTCTYLWSTGDTLSSIMAYPHANTTYQVEVSSHQGRCAVTLSKDIYVKNDEPIVINRTICHGQVYKDEYFEAAESGSYTTEVDNGDCKQKVILNLTVLDAKDTILVEDVICQGAIYQRNGFNLKPSHEGIYYDTITLSDHNGCDSVLRLRLNVLPAERDTQYAMVCQNEAYRENGYEIPAYQRAGLHYWERTDQATDGCTVIHVLGLRVDTVYQISMVDSACYLSRYQANGFDLVVEEEGYSLHYLTLQSVTHCDSVIALRLKALERATYTYYDTILFGGTYRDQNFDLPAQSVKGNHTFDTTYLAQNGCDSTVVLELYVRGDDEVNVPTAFTPSDGNGINDRFMEGYEIYVYDRYGLLLCHSKNGWDGTYRGEPADAGVYIYTIRFRNGTEKHGTVEIIKN